MNAMETKLNILIDGLRKKEQSLLEIVSITENQGTVLESELPEQDAQDFFMQMNRLKQVHIQTVISCDNLFESILNEIGGALDSEPEAYKPQVQTLQEGIKKVMDLDVKIRVLEEKNNRRSINAEKKPARPVNTPPGLPKKQKGIQKDTQRIIEAYKNNARN
jgi:hypothetical protein